MQETLKTYSVRVDQCELEKIELTYCQYATQLARNVVRDALAKKYQIPRHYIRLVRLVRGSYKKNKVYDVNLNKEIDIQEEIT